jgi:DNA-binding NarL/FixJ family response regulator
MAKKTIFLVDDNTHFREALKSVVRTIASVEYIGEAENGEAALVKIREQKPEIVLVDIEMPKLNGSDLIAKMKDHNMSCQIIVISQSVDSSKIMDLVKLGIDGHILKSEGSFEITRAIKAVASGNKYFGPKIGEKYFQLLNLADTVSVTQANKDFDRHDAVNISERELAVIKLIAQAKSNKEIAQTLGCSENTVKSHRANVMRKLRLKNSNELILWFQNNHK